LKEEVLVGRSMRTRRIFLVDGRYGEAKDEGHVMNGK
jgi:hypothetical protein